LRDLSNSSAANDRDRRLPDEPNSVAIVRAIAGLADTLNMTTTAEGVETRRQLEAVKVLGCTEIQGYLVSRPRPASELPGLFEVRAEGFANVA